MPAVRQPRVRAAEGLDPEALGLLVGQRVGERAGAQEQARRAVGGVAEHRAPRRHLARDGVGLVAQRPARHQPALVAAAQRGGDPLGRGRLAHRRARQLRGPHGAVGQLGGEQQAAVAFAVALRAFARPQAYCGGLVSPFWIWTQVAIVIFVLAGIVIGIVKLVS